MRNWDGFRKRGEKFIYDDLPLIRLLIDSTEAIRLQRFAGMDEKLLHAFADGINYYLYKKSFRQTETTSTRFEPWYPLLWTDGSIGAINTAGISVSEISHFYNGQREDPLATGEQPEKRCGRFQRICLCAIDHRKRKCYTLHQSACYLYFRPEVYMVSEEGLNAYGAVTWGQFFIYQGFNEHCGWMHTSSGVDAADTYIENYHALKKDGVISTTTTTGP